MTVGDVALLYTDFTGTMLDESGARAEIVDHAIEVLRRQPDGGWKLVVGDPRGRGSESPAAHPRARGRRGRPCLCRAPGAQCQHA